MLQKSYFCTQIRSKLSACEKQKAHLSQMLTKHFLDCQRRSALSPMRMFIGAFDFWTSKIETHAGEVRELLQFLDMEAGPRSCRRGRKTSAQTIDLKQISPNLERSHEEYCRPRSQRWSTLVGAFLLRSFKYLKYTMSSSVIPKRRILKTKIRKPVYGK